MPYAPTCRFGAEVQDSKLIPKVRNALSVVGFSSTFFNSFKIHAISFHISPTLSLEVGNASELLSVLHLII